MTLDQFRNLNPYVLAGNNSLAIAAACYRHGEEEVAEQRTVI